MLNFKTSILKEIIVELNSIKIRAYGTSMEPTIKNNDILNITPVDSIDVGDIFLYKRNYDLLCHRLVNKTNLLYMKGDNENFIDIINPNDIIGKYTYKKIDNSITVDYNYRYKNYKFKVNIVDGILEKIEVENEYYRGK